MKKITKIFASVLTAALLCGGAATMASCDKNDNKEPSGNEQTDYSQIQAYKVKVVYPDGKPVAGVSVQICQAEDCKMPVKTGSDGVAVLTYNGVAYPEAEYEIHLQGTLPAGYKFDNTKYKTPATYGDIIVVTLEAE